MKEGDFKQQLAHTFNQRTNYDSEGDFHPRLAHLLVEYAEITEGQHILDMATGTGLVAIAAAQLVGSQGRVIGVDISPGMLAQAKQKIEAAKLKNIELLEADAETIELPENSFDRIFCCSALVFMRNIPATLYRWRRLLKTNGLIAVNGFAETAHIKGVMLIKVAKKYRVSLIFNQPTGTVEKCHALLQEAGFDNIEVKTDQLGGYINWSREQEQWESSLKHPFSHPLMQLSRDQLDRVKEEYFAELEALVTEQGIWNDITTFSVLGCKN